MKKHLTARNLVLVVLAVVLLVWLAITMNWLPPGDTHETPLGAGERLEERGDPPGAIEDLDPAGAEHDAR